MATTQSEAFTFRFKPAGDDISDENWKLRREAYIACWEEASAVLAKRTYIHDGEEYLVECNWRPMLQSHRHYAGVMENIDKLKSQQQFGDRYLELLNSFQRSARTVRVTVTSNRGSRFGHGIAQCYLYDVFTIANLAAPGCCNFYLAKLLHPKQSGSRWGTELLSLSDSQFEVASVDAEISPWPKIHYLGVGEVADWYFLHRTHVSQVAQTSIERSLFCLWHIARSEGGPEDLVWIFHALEEFLGTGPNEGRRVLRERLRLLLCRSEKQNGDLNRDFKDLYERRSEFVHGGLDLMHPLQHSLLQREVDELYFIVQKSVDFGFRLLLAVVQQTIANGWEQPQFSVSVSGKPIGEKPNKALKQPLRDKY